MSIIDKYQDKWLDLRIENTFRRLATTPELEDMKIALNELKELLDLRQDRLRNRESELY